jgi:hypothetical protein
MRNRLAAAMLALPLFFCSPQTTQVPVAPAGSALVVAIATVDTPVANAAPDPLLQRRMDAAAEVMKTALPRYSSGQSTLEEMGFWSERLFAAQQGVLKGKDLSAAAQARVEQWKRIEALASTRVASGMASSSETAKATYFRASAEIDAAR